jgi:hypothetical protein
MNTLAPTHHDTSSRRRVKKGSWISRRHLCNQTRILARSVNRGPPACPRPAGCSRRRTGRIPACHSGIIAARQADAWRGRAGEAYAGRCAISRRAASVQTKISEGPTALETKYFLDAFERNRHRTYHRLSARWHATAPDRQIVRCGSVAGCAFNAVADGPRRNQGAINPSGRR